MASLMAYRRLKIMAMQRPSHKLCHRRGNMSFDQRGLEENHCLKHVFVFLLRLFNFGTSLI